MITTSEEKKNYLVLLCNSSIKACTLCTDINQENLWRKITKKRRVQGLFMYCVTLNFILHKNFYNNFAKFLQKKRMQSNHFRHLFLSPLESSEANLQCMNKPFFKWELQAVVKSYFLHYRFTFNLHDGFYFIFNARFIFSFC